MLHVISSGTEKKEGREKIERERESVVNDERKLQNEKSSSSSIWFRRVDDDGFVRCIIMSSKGERGRRRVGKKTFTSEPGRRGEED